MKIKKKSGSSINPDIHNSKASSSDFRIYCSSQKKKVNFFERCAKLLNTIFIPNLPWRKK